MREDDGSHGHYRGTMTKIVVITGWDRSGSTIIASALGSAEGMVAVGEITNLWERGFAQDRQCSCGQPFSGCDFWGPVATTAFGDARHSVAARAAKAMTDLGNLQLVQRQLRGKSGVLDGSTEYGELMAQVYSAVAEVSGASVLVDSSKKPWHTAVAMGLDDFDVFALHVVRDPRGVAFSFQKQVQYDDEAAMARHSPTFSSLAWAYRNRLTEAEWGESSSYLRLRYEDFVRDPRSSLNDIFQMLDHKGPLPLNAEDELVLTPSHNIAGNPARFQTGTIRLRLDDAWREKLAPGTRRYVSALTAVQRRRYGYD